MNFDSSFGSLWYFYCRYLALAAALVIPLLLCCLKGDPTMLAGVLAVLGATWGLLDGLSLLGLDQRTLN